MYVYEISSRVDRISRRSSRWRYEGHRHRISREIVHLENQAITNLLLITLTRRLGEALNENGEQALLRSIVKLRFCAGSNRRLLMVYAKNPKDASTLAAHWPILIHQIQKILSHEGFLAIYQGMPGKCQEILTMFITSTVDALDSI